MTPVPTLANLIGAKRIRSETMTFYRPGVVCVRCREEFSVFLARPDFRNLDEVPDPFHATCPLCEHEATYPKSSIYILVVGGPR